MATVQIDTRKLIGMEEVQACRLIGVAGGIACVTIRDHYPLITNTDFRMDRVNLEIRHGKVLRATVG